MPTGAQRRVVVVDDDPVALTVAARALGAIDDLQLVGTAVDGPSGLRLLERHVPDVAVLDFDLPGLSGEDLASFAGSTRCVLWSANAEACRRLARGGRFSRTVHKDAGVASLVDAVRSA